MVQRIAERRRDRSSGLVRDVRILVVCTANVIRSPFIAGLLRARLARAGYPDVGVDSAGVMALEGRAADARVVEVARAYGVDLGDHRSTAVTDRLLDEADTILCAARDHRDSILRIRPDVLGKTFTLREFSRALAPAVAGARETDWRAVSRRVAAHRRSHPLEAQPDDEDVRDPVAGGPAQWQEFEEQAVTAVAQLLGVLHSLPSPAAGVQRPESALVTVTRRAYRQQLLATQGDA